MVPKLLLVSRVCDSTEWPSPGRGNDRPEGPSSRKLAYTQAHEAARRLASPTRCGAQQEDCSPAAVGATLRFGGEIGSLNLIYPRRARSRKGPGFKFHDRLCEGATPLICDVGLS